MATQEIALPRVKQPATPLIDRLHGLVVTVDHKKLGLMYVGTAIGFLVVAGLMAVAIRLQLAVPNNTLLGPDVGWLAYAPLTGRAFSRGHSTDYWILSLLLTSVGSTVSAINVIVTALTMRCRGRTLMRMPLFVWMMIVTNFMIILALPSLSAAQIMLLVDRYLGGHFFDTQSGGSAVLWQHFFWIFGHPEVYILIIPAFA